MSVPYNSDDEVSEGILYSLRRHSRQLPLPMLNINIEPEGQAEEPIDREAEEARNHVLRQIRRRRR